MKRILSLAITIALAACVTAAVPRVLSAQESLANLVPEGAIFFKSSVDLEKTWASITGSNFWKELTALKVWDETGARVGLQDFAKDFSEEVGVELTTKNIMSLFGKELAIAAFVDPGAIPKVEGYLLCRCNPKSVAEDVVKKLSDAINEGGGEEPVLKTTVYKGTTISSFKGEEGAEGVAVEVKFGFIDDVFAFGIGSTSLRLEKIVDLCKGSGASLADSPRFKKINTATKMTTGRYGGSFYADFQKVGEMFAAIDVGELPMPMRQMFGAMKQSFSVPVVMGGNYYFDRGIVAKIVTMLTEEPASEIMQVSAGIAPAVGANINYVPENAIGYVASNNAPDWEKMWPLLLEQWEKQGVLPAINMVLGSIESAVGMKIAEDMIPWMGSEFAAVFTDIDTKPGFPYPQFALMLKIKEREKAKAFVQKINAVVKELPEETGAKFSRTLHKTYDLNTVTFAIPIPMPITVSPSYGIVDDFLMISSSADLLKKMIDTSKGEVKDLASNATFKALNIPAKTNSTGFWNWVRLMDVVKSVGAWAVSSTQAQPMGESVKAAVDDYVVPIANCLTALESLSLYQVNKEGVSTATYVVRVKDLSAR